MVALSSLCGANWRECAMAQGNHQIIGFGKLGQSLWMIARVAFEPPSERTRCNGAQAACRRVGPSTVRP